MFLGLVFCIYEYKPLAELPKTGTLGIVFQPSIIPFRTVDK